MKTILFSFALLLSAALPALELQEATFGVGGRRVDVTEAFKAFGGEHEIYCGWVDGNKMAGKDPAPGIPKELTVKYKDNDGVMKTAVLPDKAIGGIAPNTPVSPEFALGSAWFGDHHESLDITEKMKEIIASGAEVTLDMTALGLDPKLDPFPGQTKLIVLFYSLDGKLYCRDFREKKPFRGSWVTGAYDPIPQASKIKSPFAGVRLDTAVWQWAIPVTGAISSENGLPPVAYLYIPETAKHLRGVVIGQFNMLERPILEHPVFRAALAKLSYGAIWLAPCPFGANFNYQDAHQSSVMDGMFRDLAKVSGYAELENIPFVGIGHSAMACFPWEMAAWKPERAIAGISYDGTFASQDEKYITAEEFPRFTGIPMLTRNGEYSWAVGNDNGVKFRAAHPELDVLQLCDPGAGHFDISDAAMEFLGYFLEKADAARNRADGAALTPVPAASGWLVDRWQGDQPPRVPAAPIASFTGSEGRWAFDREFARRLETYQARFRGKKVELLGYVQNGQLLPDKRDHLQIHPAYLPEADGQTILLKPVFLDQVPAGRAERWSGHQAGDAIAHGNDPERIFFQAICGPVQVLGPDKVAVRFDRFGFTSSRRTTEINLLAVYPGDDVYRRIVQQSSWNLPRRLDKGVWQRITFPQPADVKAGTPSLPLNAKANTGLPVEYFVHHGPAYLLNGALCFTPIPPSTKFPVEVEVTAYQYGLPGAVQSAVPVTRKFQLVK